MIGSSRTLELAAALTVAWLQNQHTRPAADDVPAFLLAMHDAIGKLATPASPDGADHQPAAPATEFTPAVSVRKSLADPNRIISMIDGRAYSSLKRHLTANGLTPAEYRERYGLKPDYPMVAPGYSKARSETAKRLGLGRKPGEKVKKEKAADGEPLTKRGHKGQGGFADAAAAARRHLGSGD